jgi:hypothetical protein
MTNQDARVWLLAAAEDYECAREIDPHHRGSVAGHYRLNSGSDKGLSLGRFHGRLAAFG